MQKIKTNKNKRTEQFDESPAYDINLNKDDDKILFEASKRKR